jgi:hypothetical protein
MAYDDVSLEELLRQPIGPTCERWEAPNSVMAFVAGPDCDHGSCWEVGCR